MGHTSSLGLCLLAGLLKSRSRTGIGCVAYYLRPPFTAKMLQALMSDMSLPEKFKNNVPRHSKDWFSTPLIALDKWKSCEVPLYQRGTTAPADTIDAVARFDTDERMPF